MNKEQKILFIAVKKAIDKWNPYDLLPRHRRMNLTVK